MGGEHGPVLVYGFVTDIIFMEDNGFDICVTYDPGRPVYTSIIIHETNLEKVLEKYNEYIEKNDSRIEKINNWAKEKGEKYNKKYECKWQLVLCGELEYHDFKNEEEILEEILEEQEEDSD